MPEANLVLALLPAKIDDPSIAFGREVNQTLLNILQRATPSSTISLISDSASARSDCTMRSEGKEDAGSVVG